MDRHSVSWISLSEEDLYDHYELQGGVPTDGEILLDARLGSIDNQHQLPLSDNHHSVFNKRHYITYGGYLKGDDLFKAPWVRIEDGFDRCTLCRRSKKGGLPWCNDGHFRSHQHRKKVKPWFEEFTRSCEKGLRGSRLTVLVPPPPQLAPTPAPTAGASTPAPTSAVSDSGMSMLDSLQAANASVQPLQEAVDDAGIFKSLPLLAVPRKSDGDEAQ